MTHEPADIRNGNEAIATGQARHASAALHGAGCGTALNEEANPEAQRLMEAVVETQNLRQAYRNVMKNKGAAGVDGVSTQAFDSQLRELWPHVREALLWGNYDPQPVRRVDIPKPDGGMRTLGIPTVLDRFIQQAVLQVLQPIFEPTFSESSYGFRPNRSAHQAVQAAQAHIRSGKGWVVDMDLEKFFDRVNHDILMSRVARKVRDKRVLKLIGDYLRAGMLEGGVVSARTEGTPQGGPLSPLLSNILLTDLDRELENRSLAFCRYADDCNIYVASEKAGLRVLASITRFVEKRLKLKVNAQKSAVARPSERKFLGYSFTAQQQTRVKIADASIKRFKNRVRELFDGSMGRSLRAIAMALAPLLRGWITYFRLTEVKGVVEELDQWLRRKLRCVLWRHWKRPATRNRELRKRGLTPLRAWQSASNGRGAWWNAGSSHMNAACPKRYFDELGLVSLLDTLQRFQRGL
jgi:RNA-directed DNA polymerase